MANAIFLLLVFAVTRYSVHVDQSTVFLRADAPSSEPPLLMLFSFGAGAGPRQLGRGPPGWGSSEIQLVVAHADLNYPGKECLSKPLTCTLFLLYIPTLVTHGSYWIPSCMSVSTCPGAVLFLHQKEHQQQPQTALSRTEELQVMSLKGYVLKSSGLFHCQWPSCH